jgi:SAM-dependent methyltransferase
LTPDALVHAELAAGAFGTSDERQRVYWESDLGHREVAHPVVAGFSRQRWAHVARRIPMAEVRDLLDVGCGSGFSTAYAPAAVRGVGCDASLRMLAHHPGAEVVMAEATTLPFADSQFDLVTCWEVLHHVAEPWKVLAEMARVARRFVVVFEPNPLNPAQFAFALADREHRWVLRYSRTYLLDQFRRAGLRVSSFERVGIIFPNKTPAWLYPWLARVPYEIPLVGISQLVVARKEAGAGPAS